MSCDLNPWRPKLIVSHLAPTYYIKSATNRRRPHFSDCRSVLQCFNSTLIQESDYRYCQQKWFLAITLVCCFYPSGLIHMKAKKKKATLTCLSCHKHHKHRSVIALLPQGLDCDGCSRQSCSHILKTKQDRSTAYYGTLLGSGIATAFSLLLLPHLVPFPDAPSPWRYSGFKYKICATINTASCSTWHQTNPKSVRA